MRPRSLSPGSCRRQDPGAATFFPWEKVVSSRCSRERQERGAGAMLNPELFVAFLLITFVLIVTPGPVVTLVIATGATEGPRAALVTVLGTTIGNGLLVGAIAFGLSWLLKSSVLVFEIIRWVGAAYLIWLGIQAWRNAGRPSELLPPPGKVHFWRGFLVALSNPKT